MTSSNGPVHPVFMRIASRLAAVEYNEGIMQRIFSVFGG